MRHAAPTIAVAGALAYDQICRTDRSLIADQHPVLNRKLMDITEDFGGCGGNIAYSLSLLNQPSLLLSCTGSADDEAYLTHLQSLGVDTGYCLRVDGRYSARAVIFTDPEGKQFTGFYPGPVPDPQAWLQHLATLDWSGTPLFIQAPYPAVLMHAGLQFIKRQTEPPFTVFVPGQYADQLSASEVTALVDLSDCLVGNEHEIHCLQRYHSLDGKLLIHTRGPGPIEVRLANGACQHIEVPAAQANVDPTGCGDAFIAAICHYLVQRGQQRTMTLRDITHAADAAQELYAAVMQGCRMAAACLACSGSQHHQNPGNP